MKDLIFFRRAARIFFLLILALLLHGCVYMKMNPAPDSDKPVVAGDYSCWMHTASNMLAGAGYGNGTTVQARADDIFAQMDAHYGILHGGWPDAALQWWLGSAHNTWPNNPYSLVSVLGNKGCYAWQNPDAPKDMGDSLRKCDMLGMCICGSLHHAITPWGDNGPNSTAALSSNPGQVRVADSDRDNGGNIQAYSYDPYTDATRGNGWYIDFKTPHPFVENIVTLSRTRSGTGANSVIVTGSYRIHQNLKISATDLHYRVGTDVNILSYRTWQSWDNGTPVITEAQPRQSITVDWTFNKPVPYCNWITITTEFVEQSWNYISYHDVHFSYPKEQFRKLPDIAWRIETPQIEKADLIPNVTGGYVIGSFDVFDPESPQEPVVSYRLVHQYLYNQAPDLHTFTLTGTKGYIIKNVNFTHSWGYPEKKELWSERKWMTPSRDTSMMMTGEKPLTIKIDWRGRVPYPEGPK
jgi:hypothetical protein